MVVASDTPPDPPGPGIYGLDSTPEEARTVLVPVPFDATATYGVGTAAGPAAILEASRYVDLDDPQVGTPWRSGIAMLDIPAEVEAWNAEAREEVDSARAARAAGEPPAEAAIRRVDALTGEVDRRVESTVAGWLQRGKLVGTVGGDHGVAFGSIAAHARARPGLGVLQVDAHADLRRAYQGFEGSHASVMYRVQRDLDEVAKLVQVGLRDLCSEERRLIDASEERIVAFYDVDLARGRIEGEPFAHRAERIVEALPEEVYVSLDVDGLDPSLAPHTGTPVPGGLGFHELSWLLGEVARSGRRLVGFDLVEVAPGPEGDHWDADVGSRLLYKLIGWSLRSLEGEK